MMLDARKLSTLLETPEQLLAYLGEMSNAQFRNASRVLGERLLPSVDNDVFWQVFRALLLSDRKAYLGTLLKALVARLCPKGVHPTSEVLDEVGLWTGVFPSLCQELTDTDRKKILLALLPLFASPSDAERLLLQCGLKESSSWIPFLLQVQSKPCYFLLLKALRYVEHDKPLLIRTCHFLMKRGDGQSFNMASILRLSFGLEEVRGTFSLSLEPYQLARIEQNYDAFLQVMGR